MPASIECWGAHMTRKQWTGLAGLVFGAVMLVAVLYIGSTPDSDGAGAVAKYTEYWTDDDNQQRAAIAQLLFTYLTVVLLCFAAGLRKVVGADNSAMKSVILAAGTAAAALLMVGGTLTSGVGLAGDQTSGYQVDGNHALLLESVGYFILVAATMSAAAMAVAVSLENRRTRVLPAWTIGLTGLFALGQLGSIYTAWSGFMLLPIWSIVIGICLLATKGAAAPDSQAASAARDSVAA